MGFDVGEHSIPFDPVSATSIPRRTSLAKAVKLLLPILPSSIDLSIREDQYIISWNVLSISCTKLS